MKVGDGFWLSSDNSSSVVNRSAVRSAWSQTERFFPGDLLFAKIVDNLTISQTRHMWVSDRDRGFVCRTCFGTRLSDGPIWPGQGHTGTGSPMPDQPPSFVISNFIGQSTVIADRTNANNGLKMNYYGKYTIRNTHYYSKIHTCRDSESCRKIRENL